MSTILNSTRRSLRLAFALVATLGIVSACIEWDRSGPDELADIRVFISGVQTQTGEQATYVVGAAPAAGVAGQLSANIPAIVLRGGSALVTFTSATPFSRVVISVDDVTGYYDLTLPANVTSAEVLIIYAQQVGGDAFTMQYAGGAAGVVGPYSSANTAFLGNGTGEVQVNITWNSVADVDLYVVDPSGEELYYADRNSNSGGMLDIDSNAGCQSDGPRSENVFWPFGIVAPRGSYQVRVNYWSSCGAGSTDYVVTIRTQDGIPIIYTGQLTGAGVGGGAGAGQQIATFTY
ncbi:MAG TPA: hypothetical protein VJR92_09050 [Gemmatimonadaceae bacterium]|nr:hypothetical protein [Gemmatimonadaceae bacterium]